MSGLRCILLATLVLAWNPGQAATAADCFSCDIPVASLDEPLDLSGRWLFTRDDQPSNRGPDIQTDRWVTVETPGPWNKAYADRQPADTGWYYGHFSFGPAMIGRKVVFYVDAHMSRMEVFLDGTSIFRREGAESYKAFHPLQPVPIIFEVTKPQHVITFRIATPLGTGVYQLPFQLRPYKSFDPAVTLYQVLGSDAQLIAAVVLVVAGSFFLLVFLKAGYRLYLIAGLTAIAIFPFYALPHSIFIALFDPDILWILHYLGLPPMALGHLMVAQSIAEKRSRWDRLHFVVVGGMMVAFIGFALHFDSRLFQPLRKVSFLYCFGLSILILVNLTRASRKDGRYIPLLICESVFALSAFHDMMLALGIIKSISLIFAGTLIGTSGILYTAAVLFAETFAQKRALLKKVEAINENLEKTVEERTRDLRAKTNEIKGLLDHVPQGIVCIEDGGWIARSFSAFLPEVLGRSIQGHESFFEVLISRLDLSANDKDQIWQTILCSLGESRIGFDMNCHLLPTLASYQSEPKAKVRTLMLTWNPLLDEAEDHVTSILVTVLDVTAEHEARRAGERKEKDILIIAELVEAGAMKCQQFFAASAQLIEENSRLVKGGHLDLDSIKILFINIHTVKGAARTLGFKEMTATLHEVESVYSNIIRRGFAIDRALIEADIDRARAIFERYRETDEKTLGRAQDAAQVLVSREFLESHYKALGGLFHQTQSADGIIGLIKQHREELTAVIFTSVSEVMKDILSIVPKMARDLGKDAPLVDIETSETQTSRTVEIMLRNVFVHILRNALDHGIEEREHRLSAGKPVEGRITIRAYEDEDNGSRRLIVTVKDDGRGLALDKLRAKGKALGLLGANASDAEVAALIFAEGVSTAPALTDISGRGVGMGAIKRFIEAEGGSVTIRLLEGPSALGYRPFETSIIIIQKFQSATEGGAPWIQSA